MTTSVAGGGLVNITLQIPADKGNIREITRVATGTTLSNLQGIPALSLNYNTTSLTTVPIAGNGNVVTFSSTLALYSAYRTRIGTVAGAISAGAVPTVTMTTGTPSVVDERAPNFIRYWFLIKLDDGTEIVTTEVRVRILP